MEIFLDDKFIIYSKRIGFELILNRAFLYISISCD